FPRPRRTPAHRGSPHLGLWHGRAPAHRAEIKAGSDTAPVCEAGRRRAPTQRVDALTSVLKAASEGGGLLGHRRVLVGGLVLVYDALRVSLVQLAGDGLQRGLRHRGAAGGVVLTELADRGALLGLVGAVALGGLGVGLDALDLG